MTRATRTIALEKQSNSPDNIEYHQKGVSANELQLEVKENFVNDQDSNAMKDLYEEPPGCFDLRA